MKESVKGKIQQETENTEKQANVSSGNERTNQLINKKRKYHQQQRPNRRISIGVENKIETRVHISMHKEKESMKTTENSKKDGIHFKITN